MKRKTLFALVLAAASAPDAAIAAAADAGWTGALRYRHEGVADDAFAREAAADTLRLRLGYQRPLTRGLSAMLEIEGVATAGNRFNSGANGATAYPVVADPAALEVNQAWLRWQGEWGGATLGRQRLLLDNQRFVGNVGWRQNEQTYDGLVVDASPRDSLVLRYAWLDRVHRVFSDQARDPLAAERRLDAHLLNANWQGDWGTAAAYGYWIDDEDISRASTRTLGLRWAASRALADARVGWTLEVANQRDYARNPVPVDADYVLLEPSLTLAGLTWKLGWETLGGDGRAAFQTPLATLHAFNGWADKFLVTPANGLSDRYASVSGSFRSGRSGKAIAWTVAWHAFKADRGGADYGREWDASLSFPLPGGLTGLLKVADYRSDGFARDTRKTWFQVEWLLPMGR